jgi:4-hydroxy-tetrahydrodipicolinate reductase
MNNESSTTATSGSLKIALIGYGKMGKAIEEILLQRNHTAPLKIDINNIDTFNKQNLQQCDVAIEFTGPHSAVENITKCLDAGIPVISGSTGWLEQWPLIKTKCEAVNGALLYASNFSVGVNIFFELNKKLAQLMSKQEEYGVTMEEIHKKKMLQAAQPLL